MPNIMLAEDDQTMVALLKTLLGIEGYLVEDLPVDNIFELVRDNPPDILLLDVNLPNVNGLDILDQIRADEQIKNLVVIMTSGQNLENECTLRGADDFLLKPYMPEDLMSILKRNLPET